MSGFFDLTPTAEEGSLAILHLKRDSLTPITLKSTADDGYAEGAVTNTRFGSFPHTTLIGMQWGSQVRASKVDTGTRGRKGKKGKKHGVADAASATGETDQTSSERKAKQNGDGSVEQVAEDDGQATKKRRSEEEVESADEHIVKKARTQAGQPESSVIEQGAVSMEISPAASERIVHPLPPKPSTIHQKPKLPSANATLTQQNAPDQKPPHDAESGFVHLLPPTPESWTSSLDHRTQVVYTPDYSYILQRLRVRPGDAIIEAGAGSGSFTHAAARAVFNGYPNTASAPKSSKRELGKVYSYEYHEPRVEILQQEITSHGLDGIVHLTHRDVCNEGFLLISPDTPSPNAQAIFLDLPAPWQALRHLTRSPTEGPSPLDPGSPVHLCTFSPCIEQVIATCSYLRSNGWSEIQMFEVANRRLDVRREQVGLKNEGLRGVNASAATVEEALSRLREIEQKAGDFHATKADAATQSPNGKQGWKLDPAQKNASSRKVQTKAERLAEIKQEAERRKLYKEGNLVHRTEMEVKTHTSYLVFAVLPRSWGNEDEAGCVEKWSVDDLMRGGKVNGEGKKGSGS
ncbi:hypothetical protein LTR62_000506 [Meristemomyces frigidus]|uniref:tRNA (adenine(58)-N(1))-methyltransferase catalytic subunit TRM61 n=1 Tax=Meristemomyces frigidus TaxID=1508187 RepID=A0AAN7T8W7_9PEZI|nr:hypothetical protein LTR62_000506 [Meristemomyces frigidus]